MDPRDGYIGVFDSGLGGLSVLQALRRQLPRERFLYFGDSANAPYGSRSTQEVRRLTLEAAQKLVSRNIKALVIACNTATSAAIAHLRQTYPELIIVGIEPALKLAADRFPRGRIGVIATEVTLREEKFSAQVERFPQVQVDLIPAPGLVELIEGGYLDDPKTDALLETVLAPYKNKLDALVLGCTHYPFVRPAIARILGPELPLLDGSDGTARQTRRCLEQKTLLSEGPGSVELENSSSDPGLRLRAEALLQMRLP